MDETRDPLLAGKLKGGTGVSVTPSQAFTFPSIPEKVIRVVAAYTQLLWDTANLKKGVTTRMVIVNAKTFFSNAELRTSDALWMSHVASSLREITEGHFWANCGQYLPAIPKRDSSDEARQRYERLAVIKDWLHNVAHLGDEDRTLIKGDSMLDTAKTILDAPELTEVDESTFDRMCTAFIMELYAFFKQGIKGNL